MLPYNDSPSVIANTSLCVDDLQKPKSSKSDTWTNLSSPIFLQKDSRSLLLTILWFRLLEWKRLCIIANTLPFSICRKFYCPARLLLTVYGFLFSDLLVRPFQLITKINWRFPTRDWNFVARILLFVFLWFNPCRSIQIRYF